MTDSKDSKDEADSSRDKPSRVGAVKQSGRVAFDARGNPTWEWQTSTGQFDRNVSTGRLKMLEAEELKLAETQSVPVPKNLTPGAPAPMPGGGFNPYDSGNPTRRTESGKSGGESTKPSRASSARLQEKPQEKSLWKKLKSKVFGSKE